MSQICVSDILEEVKEAMCDNYCKYREVLDDDNADDSVCESCPLMRL